SVWTDTMVMPKSAPNPEAAYAWMNFMLDPEIAAKAVESLYFATPNQAAYDLLSDELKDNKDLFPPEEILAKCEGIAPVGDATELYERYWTEITSA
ncbi:MAG: extracellular solute-binding protein, partial [Elainellaceae cyanobacterium]